MFTISNIVIRQGRRGLYFYDFSNNLFAVDLSFCDLPFDFVVGSSTVTIEGKLSHNNFDNVFGTFTVRTLVVESGS